MLTSTFKEQHLQIWFWPLIHSFRKSSSWCYFLKWFQATRFFSLLFVLFCCLAADKPLSELQWNRPCLWAEGADPRPLGQGWMSLDLWVHSVLGAAAALLADYWYPVYSKGEAHPCKRMGTLLGQTCGTRNHYKSNCIFGWRLPSLTLPFSQNTPHCCTCIFPQGRKGNGEERHLVDITLLVQFPNSERWYPADECSIKTEQNIANVFVCVCV